MYFKLRMLAKKSHPDVFFINRGSQAKHCKEILLEPLKFIIMSAGDSETGSII